MEIDAYVDAIVNAKVSQGGNRMFDGAYLLTVKKLLAKKAASGGKAFFIAEMYVDESAAVDVPIDLYTASEKANGNKINPPNKPDSDFGVVIDMTSESGPGNVKSLLCALEGIDPKSLDDSAEGKAKFAALLRGSVAAANPFRGAQIRAATYRKLITKGPNKDKPFTATRWTHVDQVPSTVLARRAALDKLEAAAPTAKAP